MFGVERPKVCPEAFYESGELNEASQAALLLAMGSLLRPEWREQITEWQVEANRDQVKDEFGRFPLPDVVPLEIGGRISSDDVGRFLKELMDSDVEEHNLLAHLVTLLYAEKYGREGSTVIVGAILAVALFEESPLVRTTAAVSIVDNFESHRTDDQLLYILGIRRFPTFRRLRFLIEYPFSLIAHAWSELANAASFSQDPEVQEIAQTALARIDRTEPVLQSGVYGDPQDPGSPTAVAADLRSLLIHGTIPPNLKVNVALDQWWSPFVPGRLFDYVKEQLPRPDLYSEDDTFEWEGNYNPATRDYAAKNLRLWLDARNQYVFDVAPHSHGNNLVFRALNQGAKVRNILAMSCPVHEAWLPNDGQYTSIESVRVHLDLMIMADRASQRFPRTMGITETYVGWFGHGRSHEPDIWTKYDIDKLFRP